jgi:hypothetical protein
MSCHWLFLWNGYFSAITTWYPTLIKPSLIHPIGFFTSLGTLFVMMGVAAGLVLGPDRSSRELVKKGVDFLCNSIGICFVVVFVPRITKPNACWTRNNCIVVDFLKPTFNLQN